MTLIFIWFVVRRCIMMGLSVFWTTMTGGADTHYYTYTHSQVLSIHFGREISLFLTERSINVTLRPELLNAEHQSQSFSLYM